MIERILHTPHHLSQIQIAKPSKKPTAAEAALAASLSREPKSNKFVAFVPRANPPNTELRRYATLLQSWFLATYS